MSTYNCSQGLILFHLKTLVSWLILTHFVSVPRNPSKPIPKTLFQKVDQPTHSKSTVSEPSYELIWGLVGNDAKITSVPTMIRWLYSGPRSSTNWFLQDKAKEQKNYDTGGVPASSSPTMKSDNNGYRMQSSC